MLRATRPLRFLRLVRPFRRALCTKAPPPDQKQPDYSFNYADVKGTSQGNTGVYMLAYTCNVCDTKQAVKFTKGAYHEGVVIVNCQGCDAMHLIADNLGWFHDKNKNIEDIMAEKGGRFAKVKTESGWEIVDQEA